MEELVINSLPRINFGTRISRKDRSRGFIPSSIYSQGIETQHLLLDKKDVEKALKKGGHMVGVKTPDGKVDKFLLKDIQFDPLGEQILHLDLYAVSLTQLLEIEVDVSFKGTPQGVSQEGGVLEEHLKKVKIKCLASNIPGKIEIELTNLKLHDKLRLKDIKLPEGVELAQNSESLVASVHEPKVVVEAAPVETTAPTGIEPELIKKPKKEEEVPPTKEEKK